MVIYKVINTINGKWYIGKDASNRKYYFGSGKALKNAIRKYGKENFTKEILETCTDKIHLCEREKYWISLTNAINDPMSYNIAEGGEGGDLSKHINYKKRGNKTDNFAGRQRWYNNLSEEQKIKFNKDQGELRAKGWFVSRIDNPVELFVKNIADWCKENNIDTGTVTKLNNPGHHLYQKSTKGWRIRRSNMPPLPEYVDKRKISRPNLTAKNKTWKLENGKRIWTDK